ncbi:MAG TPA: GNAT family N-acetyltransferase [Mycobacteriales bacterium]
MRIVELDPGAMSKRDMQDWHEMNLAARRVDLPDDPPPAYAHSVRWLMSPDEGKRRCWFARGGGGQLLGGVVLTRHGHENAHLAHMDLRVHPDTRRRGVGRALFDTVGQALVGQDVTMLSSFSATAGPGAAFAAALDMTRGHDGLRNVLNTVDLDPAEVARLAGGAESRTAGFSLVRWTDHCPDDLIDAYAVAKAGMNDAPVGHIDTRPVTLTAERIRRSEETLARWGDRSHVLAVRENATGVLAGITEVHVHPDTPLAEQGDTTVLAPYRGRGFGLWLKASMLTWLARTQPHVTRHQTFNAADNTHMIAVNRRLGYRIADVWCEWTRRLGQMSES